jgi:hypothetical protein
MSQFILLIFYYAQEYAMLQIWLYKFKRGLLINKNKNSKW